MPLCLSSASSVFLAGHCVCMDEHWLLDSFVFLTLSEGLMQVRFWRAVMFICLLTRDLHHGNDLLVGEVAISSDAF